MLTGTKAVAASYGSCAWVAAAVRNVDDVNSSTEPSCGDLATASAPITPAAPALFSTITETSRRFASCAASARPIASLLAPGENGTTILMSLGRDGSAADAANGRSAAIVPTTK